MRATSTNFEFLRRDDRQLYALAAWAESYFRTDPNTTLIKLRQFAEQLAKDVAARLGVLASPDTPFNDVLGALARSGGAPSQTLDMFHLLRVKGTTRSTATSTTSAPP